MREKLKKENHGITLVALVVTIVVLLILAGITITYVLGDNSVFNQASKAKIQTELGKIEERAQIIYSDKLLENASSTLSTKVEIGQIIAQLESEGYSIEKRPVKEGDITGISLDKESIIMGKNKTTEIKVTYEGVDDPFVYYVEVQGKYYQMNSNKGFITIDREASTLTKADFDIEDGTEGGAVTLTVASSDETVATTVLREGSNNTIEITSREIEKEITITVTYGSYEKTCKVKVVEPVLATKITLNKTNGTATGGLSYTEDLQLTATLEPANVTEKEVNWKSSNPEIATVNSNGLVKAGTKGGDVIITATTKDGTNLSAKCDVIVEIFGAIDDNTRDYTDDSYTGANKKIKVPGGFAVGTSENVSKIENGFVIQDNKGNQFVWIPVDDPSEMFEVVDGKNVGILYDFSGTSSTKIVYSTSSYREPDIILRHDGKDAAYPSAFVAAISTTMTGEQFKVQLQSEFDSMKTSVETYKGFYIGRYETGNLNEIQAVSKRNNSDIGNQNWYIQYQKCKTIANGTKATSSMIWGCQWDATMRWLQKSKDEEVAKFPTDTTAKGYYSLAESDGTTDPKPTGFSNNYMVNNIYDIGGNQSEMILETVRSMASRGLRCGGIIESSSKKVLASTREYYGPDVIKRNYGSRSIIFVQ